MAWINVKNGMPEINEDLESDEVLCACYKLNDPIKYSVEYKVMIWDGKVWSDWGTDDYENNADYRRVIKWMYIPELSEENDKQSESNFAIPGVSGSLPDTKGDKIRKYINPTNHFIDWLIDNGQPQFKVLYDKLEQYKQESYGNDR